MELLKPGMSIQPNLNIETAVSLVQLLYGFRDVKILQLNGYDDKNYHVKVIDNNAEPATWPYGYVLKVMNSLDSQNTSLVEAQTEMALYLGQRGINCPQPIKNLTGLFYSLEDLSQNGIKGYKHVVRMLTFQPGQLLHQIPLSSEVLFKVGRHVAKVDQVLKGFHHSAYGVNKSIWSLESIPSIKKFIFAIEDESKKTLLFNIMDKFEREVLSKMDTLEKGMIHGDFNEQNIVMSSDSRNGSWEVCALLDFGDTQYSCYLFELAVNLCYMILISTELSDPLEAGGYVLAGYSTIRTLPDLEIQLLKICICARLCQSLVMGAYSYLQDPGNEYILTTAKKGWTILNLVWGANEDELIKKWKKIISSYRIIT